MRPFSRPKPPGRHTVFFQVREALQREGCAICRLSLDAVARHLDGLAYEEANDPVVRAHLRASRGFCPHHAWQIARLDSSSLDVAIIYRDVLGEVARILLSGRALATRLLPQGPCPACQILSESEDRYLGTLLDHLPEPDFAAVYRASEGLCQPHLGRALRHPALGESEAMLRETALRSLRAAPGPPIEAHPDPVRGLAEKLIGARGGLTRREPPPILPYHSRETVEEPRVEEEDLISALTEQDCPICRQVEGAEHRLLAREGAIAFHSGIDATPRTWRVSAGRLKPQFLGDTRAGERNVSFGLCNLHGWRLVESARAEALLPILEPMRREAINRLETWPLSQRREGGPLLNLLGLWHKRRARAIHRPDDRPCEVEVWSTDAEIGWARALSGAVALPELQAAFRGSSSLCLPHLVLALSCSSSAQSQLLAQIEVKRVRDLVAELNEYVRKNDYRFRDEPWGWEATSPQRAVRLLVGAEGLGGVGGIWWPDRRG